MSFSDAFASTWAWLIHPITVVVAMWIIFAVVILVLVWNITFLHFTTDTYAGIGGSLKRRPRRTHPKRFPNRYRERGLTIAALVLWFIFMLPVLNWFGFNFVPGYH